MESSQRVLDPMEDCDQYIFHKIDISGLVSKNDYCPFETCKVYIHEGHEIRYNMCRSKHLVVNLPQMFIEAPREIIGSIIRAMVDGKPVVSGNVRRWMELHGEPYPCVKLY